MLLNDFKIITIFIFKNKLGGRRPLLLTPVVNPESGEGDIPICIFVVNVVGFQR